MATMKTVVFVQIIPWLVITFATAMAFPILMALFGGFGGGPGAASWFEWYPLVSIVLVTILTVGKDFFFWIMARRRLLDNFRFTATQAIIPVLYRPFIPPPPKTVNVPPVIPASPRV
jgi:hypothetical protein